MQRDASEAAQGLGRGRRRGLRETAGDAATVRGATPVRHSHDKSTAASLYARASPVRLRASAPEHPPPYGCEPLRRSIPPPKGSPCPNSSSSAPPPWNSMSTAPPFPRKR